MHDTITTNPTIASAIAIYVVYTAVAGAQDYKKLVAGQRLWFYRKWNAELGLLTLGGSVALLAAGRAGDVTTFPSALAGGCTTFSASQSPLSFSGSFLPPSAP